PALAGGAAAFPVRPPHQSITVLSGPALAPRAPLPFPLLAAAVEQVLDADPGRLAAVADQPVTAQAVAQACLRLGTVDAGAVAAQTPLHSEVLRLSTRAHETTGSAYYPRVEAVEVAVAALDRLGQVIAAAPP